MQSQYSQQLIDQCKKVFEKKTGKSVSDEEAELILDQLARLGNLFLKTQAKKSKRLDKINN